MKLVFSRPKLFRSFHIQQLSNKITSSIDSIYDPFQPTSATCKRRSLKRKLLGWSKRDDQLMVKGLYLVIFCYFLFSLGEACQRNPREPAFSQNQDLVSQMLISKCIKYRHMIKLIIKVMERNMLHYSAVLSH